jgi:hypothetical protein
MRWPAYRRQVSYTVREGIRYLLAHQDPVGLWHDYSLPPGPSDAWTTAWVGWCLAGSKVPTAATARRHAAAALLALRQPNGWGYSASTGPDADSTAWAVRFLASLGVVSDPQVRACLEGYLDALGHAHTFPDLPNSWGAAHADVTPVVGLALLTVGSSPQIVLRLRRAVLAARRPGGGWPSFWWSADAYATAWSLIFLARSGGIPAQVRSEGVRWLTAHSDSGSAMESACQLLAAVTLQQPGASPTAANIVGDLLDAFDSEAGAWHPSPVLLVPRTNPLGATEPTEAHADGRRLMTTALSCVALQRWLYATDYS